MLWKTSPWSWLAQALQSRSGIQCHSPVYNKPAVSHVISTFFQEPSAIKEKSRYHIFIYPYCKRIIVSLFPVKLQYIPSAAQIDLLYSPTTVIYCFGPSNIPSSENFNSNSTQQSKEKMNSFSGRPSPSGRRPSSPLRIIEGTFGIRYNNRHLPKHTWEVAKVGIMDFRDAYGVECRQSKSSGSYEFILVDKHSGSTGPKIVIGPGDSRNEHPSCNCGEAKEYEACKHMFWLFDNLLEYEVQGSEYDPRSLALRHDGHALPSHLGPFMYIANKGLSAIVRERPSWSFVEKRRTRRELTPTPWLLNDQINDLLASYEPSGYTTTSISNEDYERSPSLSGAIYRIALSNPGFLANLRKERSIDASTRSHFRRIEKGITRAFERWVTYTRTGNPNPYSAGDYSDPADTGAPNVTWLSQKLRSYVDRIEDTLRQRQGLSPENRAEAFRLLKIMLEEVVNFDIDSSQHNYRPRDIAIYDEGDLQRNLFTNLIGQPPYGRDSFFAVSVMANIPDAGVYYLNDIRNIMLNVESRAPLDFQNALKSLYNRVRDHC